MSNVWDTPVIQNGAYLRSSSEWPGASVRNAELNTKIYNYKEFIPTMTDGLNQTEVSLEQLFKVGSAWCAFRNDSDQWIQISREKAVVWQGIKV